MTKQQLRLRSKDFLILLTLLFIFSSLGFIPYTSINSGTDNPVINSSTLLKSDSELIVSDKKDDFDRLFSKYLFPPDSLEDSLNTLQADSLGIDSLALDTIKIDSMALDSTARLKYFRYDRDDKVNVEPVQKRESGWFLKPSSKVYKRTAQIDSTGKYMEIMETVAGKEMKSGLKIPLDEYIKLRAEANSRSTWEEIGRKYELKSGKKNLSDLITDITNIEIPLPSSKVLSIFGKPVIKLRINGAVDIYGAWRSETTEGFTASRLGNTRNEPDFKQTVAINVSGSIGDKLTINADWNTERDFEYQNQLKIQYTGYEDEIIQSIEAGNVSLQTSSLVGGSEALFGIKAKFQLGAFSLTALASQKKGETEEKDISSGSTSQTFEKHLYEYSKNHFFLDSVYTLTDSEHDIFYQYYGKSIYSPNQKAQFYEILDIELYKTINKSDYNADEIRGNAFIDLEFISSNTPLYSGNFTGDGLSYRDTNRTEVPGEILVNKRFEKLSENLDYRVNPKTGYITFLTSILDEEAVAVAFRIQGPAGNSEDMIFGEFNNDFTTNQTGETVRVFKLVKPEKLKPEFKKAWKLQLKNIYPIGGRSINEEGFTFDIVYEKPGAEAENNFEGLNYLEAFGLDILDDSKNINADGKFDFETGRTINQETGEIIFPVLEPFGKDLPEGVNPEYKYESIYSLSDIDAKKDNDKDKFRLRGEYSAASSSTYSIGFNVVENSVKVILGGRELKAGVDYRVDYNIGQVTIMNQSALVPGASLKISYEQNDLFSLASKTLFGFRGLYEFNENTKLGVSYLNLSQKTLSDKVRIGEEPMSNSIFGADFNTEVELPFLTKGLDYLLSTRTMSSIGLKGEFAYMSPEPNTKTSKIDTDEGKSIAYIDDFEGSKRIIPIGITYSAWRDLSVPVDFSVYKNLGLDAAEEVMRKKARAYWYNNNNAQLNVSAIWGDRKKVAREDQNQTVLDFYFDPNTRGRFNNDPDLGDPLENWGGMMKTLSSTASNLEQENIEFIEFWVNIFEAPDSTKLYFDLGQISEDVIPNRNLDKEDQNNNYRYDDGEDTGLDGLTNAEEQAKYGSSEKDPSLDDFDRGAFSGWNGTEGNSNMAELRIPDSEDLDNDGSLDQLNSYFRYEVSLDTSRISGGEFKNPMISGNGLNGWFQFRIPLKDYMKNDDGEVGRPTLTNVEMLRMWVTNVASPVHLKFVEMNLVGNQWQKVLVENKVDKDDEVLVVETISYEDNPEYVMPPGVNQERDRSQTDDAVYKNEQSLKLDINDLQDGDKREIIKYLYRPLDAFNYKEMKLFVHGDTKDIHPDNVSHYVDEFNYSSEVYFRFGSDTSNFYEYRQPVRADWNEIQILFEDLTSIKETRDSINVLYSQDVPGKPGHKIGVKGNPTLTKISFFIFGVLNPRDKGPRNMKVNGEIWINELRVLDADDKAGMAYSFSTNFKLADLMSVSFNTSKTDPYFHKLSQRFGSRTDNSAWGANIDFDVMKLVPGNTKGSSFKINYRHNESNSKPLYLPGTDIKVDKAAEQLEQKLIDEGLDPVEAAKQGEERKNNTETIKVTDTWSLSNIKFNINTDAWYVKHTINSMSFAYSYNKSFGRTPTVEHSRNWVWNFKFNYNLDFGKDLFFYPANIPLFGSVLEIFKDYRNAKVYFMPQSVTTSLSANRNWSYTKNRILNSVPKIQRDFKSTRNLSIAWKITEGGFLNLSANYKANFTSSLAHLLVENGIERTEGDIWRDIFAGEYFGKDNGFTQSFDVKVNPKLPSLWKMNRYFILNFSYGVNYSWKNNFQQEQLGRQAGFQSRLSTGVTLKLQQLMTQFFGEDKKEPVKKPTRRRGSEKQPPKKKIEEEDNGDGNNAAESENFEEEIEEESEPFYSLPLYYLQTGIKYIFFDYDNIQMNFSQNNSQSGSGILGEGTGFSNFWGPQKTSNGPSRLFMLGLQTDIGARAPGGRLSDNYSQTNQITFKTSRPLWEGAKISLDWDVSWGVNKSNSISTDDVGAVTIESRNSTGKLDKSYFSMPLFGNNIKKVNDLYDENSENPIKNLSESFQEGLESFPIFAKLPILKEFAKYVPRPNWSLSWSGLEKLPLIKTIVNKATLSHGYKSSFSEGWKLDRDEEQEVQTQRISYSFSPLIGVQLTFDKLWGGNLKGSIKYNTKTSYDLKLQTKNITESFSSDISVTASFSKSGFEIPLFGLALKNDIDISLSYTTGDNKAIIYEMGERFKEEGKPQDGTIRTTIEPKVNYTLSSKVKLGVFYKRSTVSTEGASRIPPTTTNEAGVEVHISIN
ncbi:MAG: cell surface protein SprA [Melioribacteraceae bacterium]|nr:cell surface protein SprA [Melioribacteraceae bacterium]